MRILKSILIGLAVLLGLWMLLRLIVLAQFYSHPRSSNGHDCSIAHIYLPERLTYGGCKTVRGVIVNIKQEPDGDYHALLKLDPEFDALLTPANYKYKNGLLVIEDVCYFSKRELVARLSCRGYSSPNPALLVGQDYEITGNYVHDLLHHRWAELHGLSELMPLTR